ALPQQKIFPPPLPLLSQYLAPPRAASSAKIRQQLPCGTSIILFIYTLVYTHIVSPPQNRGLPCPKNSHQLNHPSSLSLHPSPLPLTTPKPAPAISPSSKKSSSKTSPTKKSPTFTTSTRAASRKSSPASAASSLRPTAMTPASTTRSPANVSKPKSS